MFNCIKGLLIFFLVWVPSYVLADPLLEQIKGSINSPPIVRGTFVQNRTLTGVSKKLISEGFFIVDKTRGVLWITEKPIYQSLAVTEAGITIRSKSNTLMNLNARNDPSIKYVNELMLAILSGDMGSLEKIFNYSGDISQKGWALELLPKNNSSAVFKRVSISGNASINQITFMSKDGDLTDIIFTNVKSVASLTKDEILQFQ